MIAFFCYPNRVVPMIFSAENPTGVTCTKRLHLTKGQSVIYYHFAQRCEVCDKLDELPMIATVDC